MMTIAFASRADWKISRSAASRRPISRKATAGKPSVTLIQPAIDGDI
ncbi:MAG TPA: hypothetical protein PKE66_12680 [Pyrinomonadaceae bacterium]|nr:hypothetical protein [Pyrinomonadaceae bacterium]